MSDRQGKPNRRDLARRQAFEAYQARQQYDLFTRLAAERKERAAAKQEESNA